MAEFPDLGKNCAVEFCHILDFLPFSCDGCRKIFCSDHRQPYIHNCPAVLIETKITETTATLATSVKCTMTECGSRALLPVLCQLCNLPFCVPHRHPQDHNCSHQTSCEISVSKILVKSKLESKRNVPKKEKVLSKKAAKTAAQVNLMKIKLNAVGDVAVPTSDRVYFMITLPDTSIKKGYYFSKLWTIGKVVDYTACAEDLVNLNNVASAKKLKIFKNGMEEALPMNRTIDDLLSEEDIFNGESLHFHYL